MSWAVAFRVRQYLKGSLWVPPLLCGVVGVLLSQLDQRLERTVNVPADWQYSAATATSVLTAIVGASVALLGFVVTMGVLVVQLATGTLSPRFMRLWYRDRLQKIVLAAFCRRLRAMLVDLLDTVRLDRRPAVRAEIAALDALGERSFADPGLRAYAAGRDRQGVGGTRFAPAGAPDKA